MKLTHILLLLELLLLLLPLVFYGSFTRIFAGSKYFRRQPRFLPAVEIFAGSQDLSTTFFYILSSLPPPFQSFAAQKLILVKFDFFLKGVTLVFQRLDL